MSSHYIYSTLTCDQAYTIYAGDGEIKRVVDRVVVRGGSNVADKRVITPRGVVTQVNEEQLEMLKSVRQFREHVEAGFLKITHVKTDPEKIAADLVSRDKSAPLVDEDYILGDHEGAQPQRVIQETAKRPAAKKATPAAKKKTPAKAKK